MPLLNGSSVSSVVLRVPSGNTISESPCSTTAAICAIGSSRAGLRVAVDEHGAEHALRDVRAQPALAPVVGARDRPRPLAQVVRQAGPEQHEIAVAVVVRVIDARARRGRAALPQDAGAGQRLGEYAQRTRVQRVERHRMDRVVFNAARWCLRRAQRAIPAPPSASRAGASAAARRGSACPSRGLPCRRAACRRRAARGRGGRSGSRTCGTASTSAANTIASNLTRSAIHFASSPTSDDGGERPRS